MYTHSTTVVSKNIEPPNLRYGNACATCKMGIEEWEGEAWCEKYQCYTTWHSICDEYERSADE